MEVTHIIFDLDGTLVDSRFEMISTYKKVFAQLPPVNNINAETLDFGAALPVILESVYGKNEILIEKGKSLFIGYYDNSTYEQTSLYPKVIETLEYLNKKGFVLHIATNKRMTPTVKILKAKQIFSFFKSIETSDSRKEKLTSKAAMVSEICKKFNIKKGFMVGDSIPDIEAGENCGLATIAALYGYEKKENLLEKTPKFAIHQFKEISTLL